MALISIATSNGICDSVEEPRRLCSLVRISVLFRNAVRFWKTGNPNCMLIFIIIIFVATWRGSRSLRGAATARAREPRRRPRLLAARAPPRTPRGFCPPLASSLVSRPVFQLRFREARRASEPVNPRAVCAHALRLRARGRARGRRVPASHDGRDGQKSPNHLSLF